MATQKVNITPLNTSRLNVMSGETLLTFPDLVNSLVELGYQVLHGNTAFIDVMRRSLDYGSALARARAEGIQQPLPLSLTLEPEPPPSTSPRPTKAVVKKRAKK